SQRRPPEQRKASAEEETKLRRLPQRQRFQQDLLRLGPLPTVDENFGDVDARYRGVDRIADLHRLVTTALVVGQRFVPLTFPLGEYAEIRQQPCLPDQITRPLVGLQGTPREVLRSVLAEQAECLSHCVVRFPQRIRVVGSLGRCYRPLRPAQHVLDPPFAQQHRGVPGGRLRSL